jgi:nicotinate phosphoribosyltransferase
VQDKGTWKPAIKISESSEKTPNPGHKQAWRLYDKRGKATADLLSVNATDPRTFATLTLHHPSDATQVRVLHRADLSAIEPLLTDVLRAGKRVQTDASIETLRARRVDDIAKLDTGVKRLVNPHIYHVSLTNDLWALKQELIRHALGETLAENGNT